MHEFSVAQSIVEAVIKAARENEANRVVEVNLEVGEVALVNMDQMGWYIDMLTQGTIAQGMTTRVIKVPVTVRCVACGYEGGVRYQQNDPAWHFSVPVFECRECGSAQTIIISGRELRVKDISVQFGQEEEEEEGTDHA